STVIDTVDGPVRYSDGHSKNSPAQHEPAAGVVVERWAHSNTANRTDPLIAHTRSLAASTEPTRPCRVTFTIEISVREVDMATVSIIKADTGGLVGHTGVHPEMVEHARQEIERRRDDLLLDGHAATCGDDLFLILVHTHGAEAEAIHSFAWDVFMATTDIAQRLGLYGAGQDLLSDAFSGNLKGLGPGYVEVDIEERPSETVLCFLADKTEPGAWNLPLYRMFADP